MDVGTQLREARLHLGLTLDGIAASTKVSRQCLDHIDHDRFDQLLGGILTKGHLRAYALKVGLDPERIVSDYLIQCFGESSEELPIFPRPPIEREKRSGRSLVIGLVAVAIGFALYRTSYQRPPEAPAANPAMGTVSLKTTAASGQAANVVL